MDSYEQILKQMLKMLQEFAPQGAELNESTQFVADLDFDSVQVMEFLPEVEDGFDIIIPLNRVEDVSSVGDLAKLVSQIKEED